MKRFGRNLLIGIGELLAVYLVGALVLTYWPEPEFSTTPESSPEAAEAAGMSLAQVYEYEEYRFPLRDASSRIPA